MNLDAVLHCICASEPLPGPGVRRPCSGLCHGEVWVSLVNVDAVDRHELIAMCGPCLDAIEASMFPELDLTTIAPAWQSYVLVAALGTVVWRSVYLEQMESPWRTT